MKKLALLGALVLSVMGTASSAAELMTGYPNWRLETYDTGAIGIWYTPTVCGNLTFNPSTPSDVKDKFFSMVLTAKATNRSIGVYYNVTNNQCVIVSFFMEG